MQFTPHPFQHAAIRHALDWFASAGHGGRICYSAPTGTGKSVVEVNLLAQLPEDTFLITPRVEIQAGLLDKMGVAVDRDVQSVAEKHRVYTPVRLRNELARGTLRQPGRILLDEGHHAESETYHLLDAYCGSVPTAAFTATPFRGTPKSTAAFREHWGEPVPIISFAEAASLGYLSVPSCRTVGLMDDDLIEVRNGEFVITALDNAVGGVIPAVVEMSRAWTQKGFHDQWDRPTMFAVPTVAAARELAAALSGNNIPAYDVTGETSAADRRKTFKACVQRRVAIVQVNVVSEGVDLPIRRLVDLRPTLSPVFWQQLFGRATRPVGEGEEPPEYVCCCRNLLRHAYLLDGCIPSVSLAEAEAVFGGVGSRAGLRVLGFEGLGRFKATELPLADGTTGMMYSLSAVQGNTVTHYVLLSAPNRSEVLVAKRQKPYGANWDRQNKWEKVLGIPDVSGFASEKPYPLTDKQAAWWKRSAATRGLNPDATVNARAFQAMPVLFDIRGKLA